MENINFIAKTDRLYLRKFKIEDLNDYHEYLSNPKVVEYEPYKPQTIDEVKQSLKRLLTSDDMIAVELISNNKMIGNIYLGESNQSEFMLGYVFNDKYWNKGYAKESCKAIINLAFKKGIKKIKAKCDPLNVSSWKLLESLGFEREAHLKNNVYFWRDNDDNPIWKDTYVYSKHNHLK